MYVLQRPFKFQLRISCPSYFTDSMNHFIESCSQLTSSQVVLYMFSTQMMFLSVCSSDTCLFRPPGLPGSGKKFWKMKKIPGQGKVRELHFQSGEFKKNEEIHGKVRKFLNFLKKMLVNRLLEILVSIICKQY